jgi:hypothetical protein
LEKSTMGVKNFNLRRSQVRKRMRIGLNQSLTYTQPFPHAGSIFLFATFQWSNCNNSFFLPWHNSPPSGSEPPHYPGFMITLRHTTLGRTPLDERSARRRDLYLITHNTHKRQTSMPPAEFEPTIPASERLQTHALDRAATGNGTTLHLPDQTLAIS